jgi:uncharacterized protein CbrC (UPF0167 family)
MKIKNDSCYIFKDNILVKSGTIDLINSYGELTKGQFFIDRVKVTIIKGGSAILYDYTCLHCDGMSFKKIK